MNKIVSFYEFYRHFSPGFTWFPQVSPGAIHIQPLRGWDRMKILVTLGDFSREHGQLVLVDLLQVSPGFTWGYSHSTPSGLGSHENISHIR